jgi:hypothetical protein
MNSKQNGYQFAGANANNTFNRRKFTSVSLAFSMVVILLMAIGMKLADASGNENYHLFPTTTHILSGVIMFGFIVAHIKLNWKAIKSYITRKITSTSKGELNKQNDNQFAGANVKNSISRQKTISLFLLLSSVVMLTVAYIIQLAEGSGIQSYIAVTVAIHVLSGFVFTGFIVAHLKMIWKEMKGYIAPKKAFMSKEVFYGLCISILPIILGLALALWNPKN